ncbi:MAG: serine/threonine protein kinase [Sandaracinaceae bacterium]|nr:serine/threonine protein kinase [Sandaracinaceae bacterium]
MKQHPMSDAAQLSLDNVLRTLAVDADTIQRAPSRTIEPALLPDEAAKRALELLQSITPAGVRGRSVHVGDLLGQGGMGEVLLADQVSMGRKVAVKRLKREATTEANTIKLLQEAWVTGYMEHPNIIPVYDITVDESGTPLILLMRIEGTQWGHLMDDPETVRERFNNSDLLEWNLRVLMQVCDAVHFAHTRGIIHRDLKPENIMIGELGEVYVVDWGIAVSMRIEHTGRIPLARHATQMAGTPCYMAPEMLGGEKSMLSERTDVYLLGAMLFEMLAGTVPHSGKKLPDIIASIISSPPPIPDGVPHELGRICRRAMDADPKARFESALQFKLALESFLRHRGSRQLARQAAGRLREMLRELERPGADDGDDERHLHLHNMFAECRFAFRESLKEWPDNGAAIEGIRRATAAMVEYELRLGDAKAAATLLSGLEQPPAELRQRVEEAQLHKVAEARRVSEIVRDNGSATGARTRVLLGLIMGVSWTLSPLALNRWLPNLTGLSRETHLGLIYSTGAFLLVGIGFAWWARDSMTKTKLNRQLMATVMFTMMSQMVMNLVCGVMQVPVETTMVLNFFLWFAITGMISLLVEQRFWVSTLGYFVALFTVAFLPASRYWVMSASHLVLTANVLIMWGPTALELIRRGEDAPPYPKLPELDGSLVRSGLTSLRDMAAAADHHARKSTVSEEVPIEDLPPPVRRDPPG